MKASFSDIKIKINGVLFELRFVLFILRLKNTFHRRRDNILCCLLNLPQSSGQDKSCPYDTFYIYSPKSCGSSDFIRNHGVPYNRLKSFTSVGAVHEPPVKLSKILWVVVAPTPTMNP